jgi:protein gp37
MSWNPVTGCLHGCEYCYARRIYQRFGRSFKPAFHPERLDQPMRRRKPSRIFVCSVADLFGTWVPQEWIDQVLAVVRQCPRHTFQFLTKAPGRLSGQDWPGNAWVGCTATNQAMWDEAAESLRSVQASVRFISAEPMLEPIVAAANWMPEWLIIGAQTGPGGKQPCRGWVGRLTVQAHAFGSAVFYKPNLIGWKSPPREFPEGGQDDRS